LGESFDLSAQDNPNREVVRTKAPLILDDAPTHYEAFGREPHAQAGTLAWLGVPLLFGDRLIGLITLDKREAAFYTEEHARLAMAFASQAAVAIENARLYRQAVLAAERRAVLHRASQEIVRALHDAEQVYQAVHRAAARLMPAEAFVIVLHDETSGENRAVYLFDKGGRWPAHRMSADQGLSGQVIATGHSQLIQDFSPDTSPQAMQFGESEPVRCILAVPLRLGDKVIGMISTQSYRPRAYSPDDQTLLEMLAAHAAAALENARLFDETQRRNRELTLLNRVIAASVAGQATEQILEVVCRELALAFDVPQSAAALFNEQKTQAVVVAEYLAPGRPSAMGEIIPAAGNPGSQHLLKYKTPLVIDDAQIDPRQAPIRDLMRRRGTVSLLLLPLIVTGQVVGSLGVDAVEQRAFSTEEVNLAQRVAEQVSGVLARTRLEEERQKLEDQFLQAQKLEAVGRLAGGIAHDFNNLLTVIYLSSRLLERKLWPEDPLWEHVQRIQDAGQRATNLTRQLLAFSRREIVEPHLLNLNEVVANLDKMLRRLIGEDIELITNLPRDLWPIKIDPSQMDQVILNMVVNARDAMPMGGSLAIETANVVLDSAYTAHRLGVEAGEYVMLAVSDSGEGMDEEVKAHLFEPFFTTKEAGKGTGLGLATVHGIVKQNNGHIWVYSEPGLGTTFKIYLPHISEGTRAPSDLPAPGMAARGVETVLLVEDETDVRELIRDILIAQGYQVLTAGDGVEALQVAREYDGPIHLLLTDVVMPQLSGRELAEELRLSRPAMHVLYTSGYTDNAMMRYGVLTEDIHFLSKPFELEALARKVREVLDSGV
jgi:two-component system cell cycle sensor histidine kinase/response regulator CckA